MIIILLRLMISLNVFATSEKAASTLYGAGKAVEAYTKEDGFKLSDKAIKNLGVEFVKLGETATWKIPASSLVNIKQSYMVYRRYEGWLTTVLVKVISKDNQYATIQSQDLEAGDEVVTAGVHFVRMTDADLNSGTVDSCAH